MGFDYQSETIIRESENRHRERRHAHIRALREARMMTPQVSHWSTVQARLTTGLLGWRPAASAPAVPHASAEDVVVASAQILVATTQELTGCVCRLADGSIGRIAIVRQSEEDWTAVCVQA